VPETTFQGRRSVSIANQHLRVTVLKEGGHVAEIQDKELDVNPLWIPPWPSIEPSLYDRQKNPEYGDDSESRLLAGIMGHNLCLDIFGPPSEEEAAAGLTVHGEASVVPYDVVSGDSELTMRALLPNAQLRFARRIRLRPAGRVIEFSETVENLTATDRPIAWTQHVTLGPPFLAKGRTEFRASATRSKVFESDSPDPNGYMQPGAEFEWPNVPRTGGGAADLRVYSSSPQSSGFTTHLMDPSRETAYFVAWSPEPRLAFGYAWMRNDFPWLGIWEENYSRKQPPWNGETLTRGMEFGASPMPETRRRMVDRGTLFGVPAFRWIPARTRVSVEYRALLDRAESVPERLAWNPASDEVRFER